MPSDDRARPHLPLSPLDLHVLVVLAREALYGYAVMQAVEEESGGTLAPEIGSLYRVLARLEGTGLLEEADAPEDAPDSHRGRPRRYYGVTALGLSVLREETERLDGLLARARSVLPEGGRP